GATAPIRRTRRHFWCCSTGSTWYPCRTAGWTWRKWRRWWDRNEPPGRRVHGGGGTSLPHGGSRPWRARARPAPPGRYPAGTGRGGERASARGGTPAHQPALPGRAHRVRHRNHPGAGPGRRGGAVTEGQAGDQQPGGTVRVAAVGDVHIDQDVVGRYRPAL